MTEYLTDEMLKFEIGNRCASCCAQTYWATTYVRLCLACDMAIPKIASPIPWHEWQRNG